MRGIGGAADEPAIRREKGHGESGSGRVFDRVVLAVGGLAVADDDREAPPSAFTPFEHLIGGWKGQGIPAKNRLKGWPEKHMWAWKFVQGKPVGMTVEIVGGKVPGEGPTLAGREERARIALEGTDPEGEACRLLREARRP